MVGEVSAFYFVVTKPYDNTCLLYTSVLICGRRLSDTGYLEIKECMPEGFEMLLLASAGFICQVPDSVLCVEMPVKAGDLINTCLLYTSRCV